MCWGDVPSLAAVKHTGPHGFRKGPNSIHRRQPLVQQELLVSAVDAARARKAMLHGSLGLANGVQARAQDVHPLHTPDGASAAAVRGNEEVPAKLLGYISGH
eukprot:7162042-Alexandrium_andersonii.AAC.1